MFYCVDFICGELGISMRGVLIFTILEVLGLIALLADPGM